MKDYIKMIVFIVILGVVSAAILIGVDALTKNRIQANKMLEFQQTILDANGTEYNVNNVSELYEELITEEKNSDLIIYTHKETLNVSFTFRGSGLWGDIYGMITLKEDFVTIVNIKVLEQEETPGLGAIVAEKQFLDRFVGKVFDPTISIVQKAEGNSEIDRITGATGTSTAFEKILNTAHNLHYQVFRGGGLLTEDEVVFKALLESYGIELNNESLTEAVNRNFYITKNGDLTLFEHVTTGNYSFIFITEKGIQPDGSIGEKGNPIKGILTLKNNLDTIENIFVYENSEVWGKKQLTKEALAKAKGFSINGTLFSHSNNTSGEIDGETGVTHTTTILNEGLKSSYDAIKLAFTDLSLSYSIESRAFILDYFNIEYNEDLSDVLDLFVAKFTVIKIDDLYYVTNIETKSITYMYESEITFGRNGSTKETILTVVTLKEDFKTVDKIVALHDENQGHWGKRDFLIQEVLDNLIGKDISTAVFKQGTDDQTGNIDGASNVTFTTNDFNQALKDNYTLYNTALKGAN